MRTTGVRLVANLVQFKREMREGAKATRGLKDEIDDAAATSSKLGDGLGKAAKSSGRQLDEMRRQTAELDKQISATERSLRELARGFAADGDSGMLKAINQQKRALAQLKNVRSLLPSDEDLQRAGSGIGTKIVGGIRTSLMSASPAALGAGAVGLLLAPTVSAAVAGAVVGGAGLGGVIGGVMLAARDDRVKAAGQELGQFVMGDLQRRATSFVPATLDGIARIRQGWRSLGPDLDRIFASSRFVAPLVDGAVKGARGFVRGFADAVEQADPIINSLSMMAAEVGTATGDMFRRMPADAKQGASAVDDLTVALTNMITTAGYIVHAGAAVKGWTDELDKAIDKGRYWIEDHSAIAESLRGVGIQIDLTGDGFRVGSAQAEAYRRATLGTATAADFATLKAAGMTDVQIAAADASGRYRVELEKVRAETLAVAGATGALMATENDVKELTQASTLAQQEYTRSLDAMGVGAGKTAQLVDGLRKATANLYGAQMQAVDANEEYEASWDSLSEAVKKNKGSLDIHTVSGRANRDALQALLQKSNEMYFADINAGVAVDSARKKHEARTGAIEREAGKLGLNRKATQDLIGTYGRIPPKKETDLVLDGVNKVVKALQELYVYQRSLAEGIPLTSARALLTEKAGPQNAGKGGGGYHEGGWTGPGGKFDQAGTVHADEFVIKKESRQKIERRNPGLLAEMNATGQVPGYAAGGLVIPVDTSRRWPFSTTVRKTDIPTRKEVAAAVVPEFSRDWPSSPSAQRGDSGVWRKVVALIKSTGPLSGSFGNGYRPGDPKWHGSGRAVDWMGYGQDALARFLAARRPLELIHRTRSRDYAYTRGRNKGSFNNSLMEAHRNHIHIAMRDGGTITEPVFGVGASGRTYSFGEGGIHERVIPMSSSGGGASGGGPTTINMTITAPVGSHPREIGAQVARALAPYLEAGGELRLSNGRRVL